MTQNQEEEKMDKEILYILIPILIALIALNIYYFTTPSYEEACYKNLCIRSYQEQDPEQHFQELLETSDKSYLVFEGDVERTETTAKITDTVPRISSIMTQKAGLNHERIHGIGMENNEAVKCDGGEKTVEECRGIKPGENEMLLYIEYPEHEGENNLIEIDNRTITIKTKSPEDLKATGIYLQNRFQR